MSGGGQAPTQWQQHAQFPSLPQPAQQWFPHSGDNWGSATGGLDTSPVSWATSGGWNNGWQPIPATPPTRPSGPANAGQPGAGPGSGPSATDYQPVSAYPPQQSFPPIQSTPSRPTPGGFAQNWPSTPTGWASYKGFR